MSDLPLPIITDHDDLKGARVLVRSSLNVPLKDGQVQSEFRLRRALPTLAFLQQAGARIILIGHIGREPEATLAPVAKALARHIDLTFVPTVVGEETHAAVDALEDGEIVMLENLRQDPRETENDSTFARELAALADVFVNDAFSVSHRAHASIVGVPEHLPSYAGMTFAEEYRELGHAMRPDSPSLFILGGAKLTTKLPLVEKYMYIYDTVFLGGVPGNALLAARGQSVGQTKIDDPDLLTESISTNERVLAPLDVTTLNADGLRRVTAATEVEEDEQIFDAGPKTITMLRNVLREADTVLWNGPIGYIEKGYGEYTRQCAEEIAKSGARSVVGGGDTISVIESLGLQSDFDFLSTAGGAMLAFLAEGTLPGIDALQKKSTH